MVLALTYTCLNAGLTHAKGRSRFPTEHVRQGNWAEEGPAAHLPLPLNPSSHTLHVPCAHGFVASGNKYRRTSAQPSLGTSMLRPVLEGYWGGGVCEPKVCGPQMASGSWSFSKLHFSRFKNFDEGEVGGVGVGGTPMPEIFFSNSGLSIAHFAKPCGRGMGGVRRPTRSSSVLPMAVGRAGQGPHALDAGLWRPLTGSGESAGADAKG